MSKVSMFPMAGNDFVKSNGAYRFTDVVGPSLTRQEFAEECDINSLMRRYEGHDIGSIMRRDDEPFYVDFANVPDNLLDYLSMVKQAESAFMTLPALVRRTFDNDPVEFVNFAADPGNLEQMREWGLAPPARAPDASASSGSPAPAPAAAAAHGAAAAASTHGST